LFAIVKEKGYVTIDECGQPIYCHHRKPFAEISMSWLKADKIRRHSWWRKLRFQHHQRGLATRQILQLPAKEQIAKKIAAGENP